MNRRELLQILSGAGVALIGPGMSRPASAQAPVANRHFVFVHANGGWDPTVLCDPKGDIEQPEERGLINHYRQDAIEQVAGSPIRYAPFPDPELLTSDLRTDSALDSFTPFFNDVAQDLLVINGIDTQTNSHTIGTRTTWSGAANLGQPAFAALVAQAQAPQSPLAFITNGGYDSTASLVAPARIAGSNVLEQLAEPSRTDFNPDADPHNFRTHYLPTAVRAHIDATRARRRERLLANEQLPQRRAAMMQLFTADAGENGLDRLIAAMPDQISRGLRGQAEVAMAAFQAQISVSANLSSGGFDTHGDHDRNQSHAMAELIDGVHHLWNLVRAAGMQDRVTILVSSDFGRRPFYNDGDGKDHWNISSMLALGAGISGNRVVGGTNDGFEALALDPQTLQPVGDAQSGGLILNMGHVHTALRELAGITNDPAVRQFPLETELLPLFT